MQIRLHQGNVAEVLTPLKKEQTALIVPLDTNQELLTLEVKLPSHVNPDNVFLVFQNRILPRVKKVTELDTNGIRFQLPRLLSSVVGDLSLFYLDTEFGVQWTVSHLVQLDPSESFGFVQTTLHLQNNAEETYGPASWKIIIQEETPILPNPRRESRQKKQRASNEKLLMAAYSPPPSSSSQGTFSADAETYEFSLPGRFPLRKQSVLHLPIFELQKVPIKKKYYATLDQPLGEDRPVQVRYYMTIPKTEDVMLPAGPLSLLSSRLQLLATSNHTLFTKGKKSLLCTVKDAQITFSYALVEKDHDLDKYGNQITTYQGSIRIKNTRNQQIPLVVRFPFSRDQVFYHGGLPRDIKWAINETKRQIIIPLVLDPQEELDFRFEFHTEDMVKKEPSVTPILFR